MIMAGGMRERGGCVGYDMGYHCIRVTTRSGGLSSSGPLVVCHTTHRRVHTYTHATPTRARAGVVTREDVISTIVFFFRVVLDRQQNRRVSRWITPRSLASLILSSLLLAHKFVQSFRSVRSAPSARVNNNRRNNNSLGLSALPLSLDPTV